MKYVLITGSTGLVGSESVQFFIEKGYKVVGIDNNFRKFLFGDDGNTDWVKKKLSKYKNYTHFNTDIRNFKKIEKIFKKYNKNIDVVIHAAAQPSHDWAKKMPFIDFNVNACGTLNILENFKKYSKNGKFIFLSTNKVYGDRPNNIKLRELKLRYEYKDKSFKKGIDENMSIDQSTHSLFGVSKTYADLIVQEYGKNFNLNTVCFRAGCITGPNHSGAKLHGFLSYLVKSCIKDKKYQVIGYKGKQVRDNIHSYDLINAFWEYIKKPKKGIVYNIGGGLISNCSILEAIKFIENSLKVKVKKKIIRQNRTGDHICYISNLYKFKKDYPKWKQTYNFRKIMKELINREINS